MTLRPTWRAVAVAIGFFIIAACLFAYFDYRHFEAETRGYLGVTFEDTKKAVSYRIGDPTYVPGEPEPGTSDALANLPARARWFPERGCGRIGNETGRKRQPSSVQPMEGFLWEN
jgi:hypothetical protein